MEWFYAYYSLSLFAGGGTLLAHVYALMRFGVSPTLVLPLVMFAGYSSAQSGADAPVEVPVTQPAETRPAGTQPSQTRPAQPWPDGSVESRPARPPQKP